jgi:hypothetical protein
MRALNILSGISVLFTTLAFGHIMHHHLMNAGHPDLAFRALFSVAAVVAVFSFIGGCLLLRRSR